MEKFVLYAVIRGSATVGENFQRTAISVSIVSFVFLITFGELILCKE